jgi:ATP-dependent DNA helicase RecQ
MDSEGRTKEEILGAYFGFSRFRRGQEAVIDAILAGRDTLAIMPTGAGKSLCYQIPALMLEGVTIVISPLISLMKDQVGALSDAGVPAACLNSALEREEYETALSRASRGEYKMLYIAPERLKRDDLRRLTRLQPVPMVVIDEAHCVSQWGHDFRPSYLLINDFIESLERRPIVTAFTATATGKVRDDVRSLLKLQDPYTLTTGFDRENLYFEVLHTGSKMSSLLEALEARREKSGIIYCATRKAVEEVCEVLTQRGYNATRYHAGLRDGERRENQDDFIYDRKPVMVATNAFGMGIDKSNVSFVIHYQMPKSIESYYQEAGRAGRDGEAADCILLYSPQDVRINTYIITKNQEGEAGRDEGQVAYNLELLRQMTFYATSQNCLRGRLLAYFGESAPANCGNCSNCNAERVETDITIEAQKIISCVYRIEQQGQRYGMSMVINILRGSKSEKIRGAGLDKLSTYGIMRDTDGQRLRTIIEYIINEGYLTKSGDEYPLVTLSPRSREIIIERKALVMTLPKTLLRPVRERKRDWRREEWGTVHFRAAAGGDEDALFIKLKELRTSLAREARVPAYIIFSDATLHDMCRRLPQTPGQFRLVSGVGEVKAEKYADVFTRTIREVAGNK